MNKIAEEVLELVDVDAADGIKDKLNDHELISLIVDENRFGEHDGSATLIVKANEHSQYDYLITNYVDDECITVGVTTLKLTELFADILPRVGDNYD